MVTSGLLFDLTKSKKFKKYFYKIFLELFDLFSQTEQFEIKKIQNIP